MYKDHEYRSQFLSVRTHLNTYVHLEAFQQAPLDYTAKHKHPFYNQPINQQIRNIHFVKVKPFIVIIKECIGCYLFVIILWR